MEGEGEAEGIQGVMDLSEGGGDLGRSRVE